MDFIFQITIRLSLTIIQEISPAVFAIVLDKKQRLLYTLIQLQDTLT